MTNPILKELHEVRQQILPEHRDDLAAYLHAELERTKEAGHPVASLKQKSIRLAGVSKADDVAMDTLTAEAIDDSTPQCENQCSQRCSECTRNGYSRRCEFPAGHKGNHRCTAGHYW